jgi:membrane protein required for colicin V production
MDNFLDFIEIFSTIDLFFIFFLIFNSFLSLKNGFVLSLLSFLKWTLSIVSIKIFLPLITPYTENIIESEFAHDMVFGAIIFIITLFITILISKGVKKTMSWTGLGGVDKFFGFIFGFLKGYVYFVSIFTFLHFIHPFPKWSSNLNEGKFFTSIVWGQEFLTENLPKRYEYIEKSKENVDKITK